MRLAALLLLVGACRTEGGTITQRARVRVLAGDVPAPGIRVLAHAPSGEVTAELDSDALGIANIDVEDDSLITVNFGRTVLTTLSPGTDTTLEIHGPPADPPALVVGVLDVNAPPLAGAMYYDVDLGCATVRVMQFPESIDIGACSQGSDRALDIVVTARDAATVIGYAAARVQLLSGIAVFDVAAWQSAAPLPIELTGVTATIALTFYSDGNAYEASTPPAVYDGLVVERTRVSAVADTRTVKLYGAGVPTAVVLQADDFLPALPGRILRDGARFEWARANDLGDAAHLSVRTDAVVWDAVLPADAGEITAPATLDVTQGTATFRYIDSSDLDSFSALQLAGIRTDTVVAAPADGLVRTTTSAE